MHCPKNPYRGFRFPPAITAHAVWLYHCFSLNLRDVELILAARGVTIRYESIRDWGIRFGRQFAASPKRRRPEPGINGIRGKIHYLWRAVGQTGMVLDILAQKHRDTDAAKRFFRKLLSGGTEPPRVLVTDTLKSYAAAKREIAPKDEHRQSRYQNNRAEVSHQLTRRRERQMQRVKSIRQVQRFPFARSRIHSHFRLRRHLTSAAQYRLNRHAALRIWKVVTRIASTR